MMFKNEEAVSEIVGALLILLILVVSLGMLQVYEVPRWNKELEMEHFDKVYDDFVVLKSNFEDVSAKNIPKTSSLHMGVRYPERFMLRNPGQGAYGTLTFYNLSINISYKLSKGGVNWTNYTSAGIEYQLNGMSEFPELIYEHGLIIKDFGGNKTSQEGKCNFTVIPVVSLTPSSISSMEIESLDIEPYSTSTRKKIQYVNVTMETNHPGAWEELCKNNPSINFSGNKIIINSYPAQYLTLPPENATAGAIYAGMIDTSVQKLTVPPFTNIDTTKANWPVIENIDISGTATHSSITARVRNVTSFYDIHADLTDITRDYKKYD